MSLNQTFYQYHQTFIMFVNKKNNCWLNSVLAIIVQNQHLLNTLQYDPKSILYKILYSYTKLHTILNFNIENTQEESFMSDCRKVLLLTQEMVYCYVKSSMRCKTGKPDSAFCFLLNILKRDNNAKEFTTTYSWVTKCTSCGVISMSTHTNPIITLSNIKTFCPQNHFSACSMCKESDQKHLIYKCLPPCLIFHFEQGAGTGDNIPQSFNLDTREYQLTAVIILIKGPKLNHFISYIRKPENNMWMICNDLENDLKSFSSHVPDFDMKSIYICTYEANDNYGIIELKGEPIQVNSNQNVPIIDILSDSESDMVQDVQNFENTAFVDTSEVMLKAEKDPLLSSSNCKSIDEYYNEITEIIARISTFVNLSSPNNLSTPVEKMKYQLSYIDFKTLFQSNCTDLGQQYIECNKVENFGTDISENEFLKCNDYDKPDSESLEHFQGTLCTPCNSYSNIDQSVSLSKDFSKPIEHSKVINFADLSQASAHKYNKSTTAKANNAQTADSRTEAPISYPKRVSVSVNLGRESLEEMQTSPIRTPSDMIEESPQRQNLEGSPRTRDYLHIGNLHSPNINERPDGARIRGCIVSEGVAGQSTAHDCTCNGSGTHNAKDLSIGNLHTPNINERPDGARGCTVPEGVAGQSTAHDCTCNGSGTHNENDLHIGNLHTPNINERPDDVNSVGDANKKRKVDETNKEVAYRIVPMSDVVPEIGDWLEEFVAFCDLIRQLRGSPH